MPSFPRPQSRRRGGEAGVKYAEAYIRADSAKERVKMPLSFLSPKK
jgi:hypothetical protein